MIDVSIIVPAYNESENIRNTIEKIEEAFKDRSERWELVVVNDGSTDNTWEVLQQIAKEDSRITPAGYPNNVGRGRALRTGFAAASGKFVVSTDADLSYRAEYILDLLDALYEDPQVDFVLGSPYMPGGNTEGVDPFRLFISKLGNRVLQATVNSEIHTFTCVFRAYRREVLDAMCLESDGKELHLEILSRALGSGFRLKEVPSTLRARKMGKSKFRFKGTAISHLLYSFTERPILVFGTLGFGLLLAGMLGGAYATYLKFFATLEAGRPLMTLIVLLTVSGIQILSFGFIALQMGSLRREIYKAQAESRLLRAHIQRQENDDS